EKHFYDNVFNSGVSFSWLIDKFCWKDEYIINNVDWMQRCIEIDCRDFSFVWRGMINFYYLKHLKLIFLDNTLHQDTHFGILLFIQAKYIYLYPKILINYRIRPFSSSDFGKNITKSNIPIFLENICEVFYHDYPVIKEYYKISSWFNIIKELDYFCSHCDNLHMSNFIKYQFLTTYILNTINILNFDKDPFNIMNNVDMLEYYINKKPLRAIGSGKIIQNSLEYKLGNKILNSKTMKEIILLPFEFKKIISNNSLAKKNQKNNLLKLRSFCIPDIRDYVDQFEYYKFKNHLSYRIGFIIRKSFDMHLFGLFYFMLNFLKIMLIHKLKFKKYKKSRCDNLIQRPIYNNDLYNSIGMKDVMCRKNIFSQYIINNYSMLSKNSVYIDASYNCDDSLFVFFKKLNLNIIVFEPNKYNYIFSSIDYNNLTYIHGCLYCKNKFTNAFVVDKRVYLTTHFKRINSYSIKSLYYLDYLKDIMNEKKITLFRLNLDYHYDIILEVINNNMYLNIDLIICETFMFVINPKDVFNELYDLISSKNIDNLKIIHNNQIDFR
ncbi:hypothetical protein CINS5986_07720, partial [Campylobacter insulaenigrae]|nr:hypothetical protein [Campylobacter insulaenigrae]